MAPIAELMDEHTALVDQASYVRQDLGAGDQVSAMTRLTGLVARLVRHVRREEAGIFRAMRDAGEFVDEIVELEGEHRDFADTIAALDIEAADFSSRVTALLDDLDTHVEREDLGIFPVSVVTLGASGWTTVDEAHRDSPSFLHDRPTESHPPHERETPCRRSH